MNKTLSELIELSTIAFFFKGLFIRAMAMQICAEFLKSFVT